MCSSDLLRTVAFTWQQDALTANAQALLKLGNELYSRLGTLGSHATRMGASLVKSVESYNALVGALESRVMVTARKMHELGLADKALPETEPVETAPRLLTAAELIVGSSSGVRNSGSLSSDVLEADASEVLEADVLEVDLLEAAVARPELDIGQVRDLVPDRDRAAHRSA